MFRYRIAYRALLELDPVREWTKEYHELRDEDNWGPLKEFEESGVGDGRYALSWIWAVSSLTPPDEGSATEQGEVNKTARHEWMTCRARADRWIEEELLLREEMCQVVVYLEWKSHGWFGKVGARRGSCSPDIQHGLDVYARKQANVYLELSTLFAAQWLPYLTTCGLDTQWATKFPWLSPIISHQTNLPKWFSTTPPDASNTIPAVCSPPTSGGLGVKQGSQGCQVFSGKQSNNSIYQGRQEKGSDDEEIDSGDEEEGESDEDGNFRDAGVAHVKGIFNI